MARVCDITGKKVGYGNHVSHANNKTSRTFAPNLQVKRFFVPEENRWVTLKVSASGLKTVDKKGIYAVLQELKKEGRVF
jgi:large subunit ribosomal protein L28